MEITLFELHFDGETVLGPSFGGDGEELSDEAETADAAADDEAESPGLPGPSPVAVLAGLVLLALVGLGVKRALGDEAEADEEFEPEMVEIEE